MKVRFCLVLGAKLLKISVSPLKMRVKAIFFQYKSNFFRFFCCFIEYFPYICGEILKTKLFLFINL